MEVNQQINEEQQQLSQQLGAWELSESDEELTAAGSRSSSSSASSSATNSDGEEPAELAITEALPSDHDLLPILVRQFEGSDRVSSIVGRCIAQGPAVEVVDVDLLPVDDEEQRPDLQQLLCNCFGHGASKYVLTLNNMASVTAMAKSLNMPRSSFTREIQYLAAACYAGTRALVQSVVLKHLTLASLGQLRIVSVMRFLSYDETPLTLRIADNAPSQSQPSKSACHQKQKGTSSKLLQVESEYCVVSQSLETGEYLAVSVTLPLPLVILESGKGRCLRAALMQHCDDIPQLAMLLDASQIVFHLDASTCDRAASNDSAEDQLYFHEHGLSVPRLRLPCFAHMVSTAQGKGFNIVQHIVTGIISTGLYMKLAGQPKRFRLACRDVLILSVVDVLDIRLQPEPNDRLEALLGLALPGTNAGQVLAEDLREPLTGDIFVGASCRWP